MSSGATLKSRPARDAWIETPANKPARPTITGRVPRGTRGLKPGHIFVTNSGTRSRPARDAWIETSASRCKSRSRPCRVPRGTRGLKHFSSSVSAIHSRRVPRGTRGLKPIGPHHHGPPRWSRPARDAWIETYSIPSRWIGAMVASRAGRVD